MQETRVLVETKGTTGEETTSYWFDLPIDVAEFEEKLGVGAESGDYRIIEKVLPFADEVHEHTSVYQLNELDFMYRQLSSDMQEEYVSLLNVATSEPNVTQGDQIKKTIMDEIVAAMNYMKTPEQAMKDAASKINSILHSAN